MAEPSSSTITMHEMSVIAGCDNLGFFSIDDSIACGQNGQVFRVRCTKPGHPFPDKTYALKAMFNFGHGTATIATAFEREYGILSSLPPHPNVVQFLREWTAPFPDSVMAHLPPFARELAETVNRVTGLRRRAKTRFFLFSFVEKSLKEFLEERSSVLDVRVAVDICTQLARGVDHLFRQGVMHLDLKLDNVLVEEGIVDGSRRIRVVLCDFGCAVRSVSSWRVSTSTIIDGNQAHRSPEVLTAVRGLLADQSSSAHAQVDLSKQASFALGCLMYEVCCLGEEALPGYPSEFSSGRGVVYSRGDVSSMPAGYPAELGELVADLVSFEAERRPGVGDAVSRLEGLGSGLAGGGVSPSVSAPSSSGVGSAASELREAAALCPSVEAAVEVGADVIGRVVEVMSERPDEVEVAAEGCLALKCLARHADNAVRIVASGGLDRVYAAMEGHPGSSDVQSKACGALGNLAVNAVRIVASGGLYRVYAAMEGHPGSSDVQSKACAALWSLAVNADNAVRIVASGGLERVYAAMEGHPGSSDVQSDACGALWNLAVNADNKVRIVASGGLERARAAATTFPSDNLIRGLLRALS